MDSELLARIAQRHAGTTGIDLDAVLDEFAHLEGSMSLALVATTRPEDIILLKGNMPLELRIHRERRLLLYASEPRILHATIGDKAGWEVLPIAPGEALVITATSFHASRRLRFTFQGMAQQARWEQYTGT